MSQLDRITNYLRPEITNPVGDILRPLDDLFSLTNPVIEGGGAGKGVAGDPKTFFVTAADAGGVNKVAVTAGAINSKFNAADLITVSDGDAIYIHLTWNTYGTRVNAISLWSGDSAPTNTLTESFTLLATVSIVSSKTVVTPVAWNYSQAQVCGTSEGERLVHYW